MNEKCVIILLAAGIGNRFSKNQNNINIEKQFYELINNKTIFEICIQRIVDCKLNYKILPVVNNEQIRFASKICKKYNILDPIIGGKSRQESVFNALRFLKKTNPKLVLIHDVARPLIDNKIISKLFKMFNNGISCVVPYINIQDSIRKIHKNNKLISLNKNDFCLIQTPQLCNYLDLCNCYKNIKKEFDDESSLMIENKYETRKVIGEKKLLKITYFDDLQIIKNYLLDEMNNYITKVGIGYDIHKLIKCNKNKHKELILGGYKVECDYFLDGHSDADVLLHSLTDSLYGALNFLDIGQHFPPTDKKWKNSNSAQFLKHASNELVKRDGKIIHIDIVVITEIPKISIHALNIKKSISKILNIDINKISIKGKSNEGIGSIGRKEGIAVLSNTTILVKDEN